MVDKKKLPLWEILILGVICLGLLAGGYMGAKKLIESRPRSERKLPEVKPPLVEVRGIKPISHQVWVSAMGTVIPSAEVTLQAEVTGRIMETHADFLDGGIITEGDVLVRIDHRNYDAIVIANDASVEKASYDLKLEEGQQDIAKREWEILGFGDDASDLERELALRKPHLRQKQAQLKTALANLDQAKLDLERTKVKAPFNSVVRSADVRVGDLATNQAVLGTLVSTDTYWVQVSVPLDRIHWLKLNEGKAVVKTGTGAIRDGKVLKLLSDLDPNGRMARLLVEVTDPLDLDNDPSNRSPLLLGEFVNVELEGVSIDNVYALPRSALRDGDKVWLVDKQETLQIENAQIVWKNLDVVFLKELPDETQLVLSDLSVPVDGMKVSPLVVEEPFVEEEGPGLPVMIQRLMKASEGEI
jgi:RND family efflux transporter MFP subunit